MKALSEKSVLALYALHLMLRKEKPVPLGELSRSAGFPPERFRPVLKMLRNAGMIQSRSGHGYLLAKAPGEISVLDIVHVVDDPQSPTAPCGGDYDACATRASCVLAPLCRSAEHSYEDTLRTFTLADLEDVTVDLPNCLDPKLRNVAS